MNAGAHPFVLGRMSVRPARKHFTTALRGLWRSRWGVLRLSIAASLLVVFASDNQARLARLQYAGLADIDYLAHARELRDAGQYDDALAVMDAALREPDAAAWACAGTDGDESCTTSRRAQFAAERRAIIAERDSVLRRAAAVGLGALAGTGESLESLAGAVAADLLVFGDVRDLAIQGGRLALDGECDKLVVILSGIGLATTLQPDDLAPAFLKGAYKAGCFTRRMIDSLCDLGRAAARGQAKEAKQLAAAAQDVRELVKGTSAATAARALRCVDEPAELAELAAYAKREKSAAFVLHVTGEEGAQLIRRAAAGADEPLLLAARKGSRGAAWLRSGAARLMRPHPLVGLAKAWHKGNVQHALAAASARYLDPNGWLVIPGLAAWALIEAGVVARRMVAVRDSRPRTANA